MTNVAIMPVPSEKGDISYFAVAGQTRSQGRTIGEALDALTTQLPESDAGMLVVVQSLNPDRYFSAAQQQRLEELMERWRTANDAGVPLPVSVQAELDNLVEKEIRASADRTGALADKAGR